MMELRADPHRCLWTVPFSMRAGWHAFLPLPLSVLLALPVPFPGLIRPIGALS